MQQHLSVVGIDLAKRVLHVAGMDQTGQVVLRKRVTREARMSFIAQLPPVVIGPNLAKGQILANPTPCVPTDAAAQCGYENARR